MLLPRRDFFVPGRLLPTLRPAARNARKGSVNQIPDGEQLGMKLTYNNITQ